MDLACSPGVSGVPMLVPSSIAGSYSAMAVMLSSNNLFDSSFDLFVANNIITNT
jgi:hypothetical protein